MVSNNFYRGRALGIAVGIILAFVLILIPSVEAATNVIFSDNFTDNNISDWNKTVNGDANAIADNGRMLLQVTQCSDVVVSRDLGFVSGDVIVEFDWETTANGWPEIPNWKLIVDGATVIDEKIPIYYGGQVWPGGVRKIVNVNGNVQLQYSISPSSQCNNVDHTNLWIDNISLKYPETSISPSIFSDNFTDNNISDWTKIVVGNADAIADNGRMQLQVYKCSDVVVSKDLGFVSGDIAIDFDWETYAEQWTEIPHWKLNVDGATVIDDRFPFPLPSISDRWSGHVRKNLNVNGNVQLQYLIDHSGYCSNGDHLNTFLWIDNIDVTPKYVFGGILPSINSDGTSIFKLGSTIPVKFQLTDIYGNYISNAIANIYLTKTSNDITGSELEAVLTNAETTGNQFRYDSTDNQYIYNLRTKGLTAGTWQIRIALDDGTSKYVTIGLK